MIHTSPDSSLCLDRPPEHQSLLPKCSCPWSLASAQIDPCPMAYIGRKPCLRKTDYTLCILKRRDQLSPSYFRGDDRYGHATVHDTMRRRASGFRSTIYIGRRYESTAPWSYMKFMKVMKRRILSLVPCLERAARFVPAKIQRL